MISRTILPLNKRLDKNQINELLGYTPSHSAGHLAQINIKEVLLKYHEALIAAEQELNQYKADRGWESEHSDRVANLLDEDKD